MTGATWRTRSVCALLSPKARFKLGLPLGSTPGRFTRFISRVWANVSIPLRRTSPTPAGRYTRHTASACACSAQTCCALAGKVRNASSIHGVDGARIRASRARTARLGAFEHLQAA